MSEITRKVAAVVLTLALALSVTAPAVQAQTAEELQTQISQLQALIAQLQAQIAGTTPAVGVPAACSGVSFNRNLSLGVNGTDVMCLQALLNTDATTRVAATGVGSAGQETQYFGNLTRAAVVVFQNKYASEVLAPVGLTAGTGFVGAQTRAKLNAMLATTPVPTTPTTPTDPTTPAPTPGVPATEGDLTTRLLPVPSSVEVDHNASNVPVMAFELEAKDSTINVQRVDLTFSTTDRPWRYINYIALYDGNNAVQGMTVNSANVTELTSTTSRIRFSGLNFNIPVDSKKELTVRVGTDANPVATGDFGITVGVNAIRGVDGLGINQEAPATALAERTVTIKTSAEGARVEVKLNANSPAEGVAITDVDVATEHEILRADLIVTRDNAEIRELVFDVTNGASSTVQAIRLYDGTTALGVVGRSATPTFSNLSMDVAAGSTKTLTLKVEVAANTSSTTITGALAATSTKITARSANGADASLTGAANGETIHFFTVAPVISNVSTSITPNTDATGTVISADARITFTLTAQGGDVVVSANGVVPVAATSSGGVATTSHVSVTVGGEAATSQRTILSGQSKVVVVDARLTRASGASVRTWLKVDSITWTGGVIDSAELLKALQTASLIVE